MTSLVILPAFEAGPKIFSPGKILGLAHLRLVQLILGISFSLSGLLCYTMGILLTMIIERDTN